MLAAPLPETEYARLMALARYEVLDSPPEESFERISRLVKEVLGVPVVMINFVDQFRQWGKSCIGVESNEASREVSFCAWAILDREPFIVTNAHTDPRFADNPMVTGAPFIHLYVGAPLITPDGHALGSLCVIDTQPHAFGEREVWLLQQFAQLVIEALELRVRQLELRRHLAASAAQVADMRRVTAHAQTLAAITALFDEDLDPALATEASAALLSQAIDVDWTGLMVAEDGELRTLTSWDHRADPQVALQADLSAYQQGVTGAAMRRQRASFIDDYPAHPLALRHFVDLGVKAAAILPLGEHGGRQYVLVTCRLRAQPWLSSDRALCEAVGRSIRGSLERRAHLRAVEVAAWRDSLTGVGNRRAFDRALAQQQESGEPYAVLMIDLDGMKAINDREGHERGDELLRFFAQTLEAEFLASSSAYRLGGDEFALLWPGLSELAGAVALARVGQVAGAVRSGGFAQTSASAGLAYSVEVGADVLSDEVASAVMRLADARMYRHKDQTLRARVSG